MSAQEEIDTKVKCPNCEQEFPLSKLNVHLDKCLEILHNASSSVKSEGPTASIFQAPSRPNVRKRAASSKDVTTEREGTEESKRSKVKGQGPEQSSDSRSVPTTSRQRMESIAPLAERLRPKTLDDYVGQESIVKGPLKALLRQGRIPSMILWGPPGTGKTTLARLVTKHAEQHAPSTAPPYRFIEISAATATANEVKKIFDEAINRLQLAGQRTVLFIDEVQRFSRVHQDLLLSVTEKASVIVIAATTENPSFRLQSALLSRMRVFVLSKLSVDECLEILHRARQRAEELGYEISTSRDEDDSKTKRVDDDLLRWMANVADGDARTALSVLELALDFLEPGESAEDSIKRLKDALRRNLLYDRTGDAHYDTISALHKSVRGSNADAALYWLARMVEAGDDPLFIARRLIVAASEDCNTLESLQMATATYQACQLVGLPECAENLAQCVVFLAESTKSTRSYRGWKKAQALVQDEINYPVPIHIRNAPTRLMRDLGYAKEYRYEPSFLHPVHQEFFPPELRGTRLLSPPPSEDMGEPSFSPEEKLQNGKVVPQESARLMGIQAGIGPGSCQRIFQIGARSANLELLDEWEREQNHGESWKGRDELLQRIQYEGNAVQKRSEIDLEGRSTERESGQRGKEDE